jgi:hypothetical protein
MGFEPATISLVAECLNCYVTACSNITTTTATITITTTNNNNQTNYMEDLRFSRR